MSLSDPNFLTANVNQRGIAQESDTSPSKARNTSREVAMVLPFPKRDTVPALHTPAPTPRPYRDGLKRLFDIVLVLASLPIWAPFILIAAFLIGIRDGHNPFYTQNRVGHSGKVFRMLKLRSMVPNAHAKLEAYLTRNPAARHEWDTTQKLKNDPRITTLGRIIRKTSLDELPQLVNVLNGDMSIVGPRPFMVDQRHLYQGRRYYEMRPGMTGFWQISDRNECNFAQRAHYDTAYFRSVSLKTDLTVIFRTVSVILRGTGY